MIGSTPALPKSKSLIVHPEFRARSEFGARSMNRPQIGNNEDPGTEETMEQMTI